MNKIKSWVFNFLHSQSSEDRLIRHSSLRVGIGVFVIVAAVFLMITAQKMPKTYADISNSNKMELSALNAAAKNNDPVTIVLRRSGCTACKNAESTIVNSVYWHRLTRPNQKIVVLDLKNMDSQQLEKLLTAFPAAKTNRGVPTPLVANLTYTGHRWQANQISTTDDKQAIKNVFSQIGF